MLQLLIGDVNDYYNKVLELAELTKEYGVEDTCPYDTYNLCAAKATKMRILCKKPGETNERALCEIVSTFTNKFYLRLADDIKAMTQASDLKNTPMETLLADLISKSSNMQEKVRGPSV
jgi:hypothetical protein